MAIVAVFQGPGLTQDAYEASIEKLTGRKGGMKAPSDWPVAGLLAHVAGNGPTGFRVVDVWESEQSFQSFGNALMPILNELGIEAQPEIYPAHTVVTA